MRIVYCFMLLLLLLVGDVKIIGAAEAVNGDFQKIQNESQEEDYTAMARLCYEQGRTYDAQGEFSKAIERYDQAIILDGKNKLVYNARGLICYKIQKYAEAHTNFTMAISLDPSFAIAYYNRSNNYRAIGADKAAIADEMRARVLMKTVE